jgi:hypothetical protein
MDDLIKQIDLLAARTWNISETESAGAGKALNELGVRH